MFLKEIKDTLIVVDYDAVDDFLREMFDDWKIDDDELKYDLCHDLQRYVRWWARENC